MMVVVVIELKALSYRAFALQLGYNHPHIA